VARRNSLRCLQTSVSGTDGRHWTYICESLSHTFSHGEHRTCLAWVVCLLHVFREALFGFGFDVHIDAEIRPRVQTGYVLGIMQITYTNLVCDLFAFPNTVSEACTHVFKGIECKARRRT
jgi:hypothetical protein